LPTRGTPEMAWPASPSKLLSSMKLIDASCLIPFRGKVDEMEAWVLKVDSKLLEFGANKLGTLDKST
jgi:hypothetical protein